MIRINTLEQIRARVTALLASGSRQSPILLGVCGQPGAGKFTLAVTIAAEALEQGISAMVVPMDGFHLADVERQCVGKLDRKGAVDTFDSLGYAALHHQQAMRFVRHGLVQQLRELELVA